MDEALEICYDVKRAAPKDDITLQAVSRVFTRAAKHQDVASLYEVAFKSQPQNEEYGNNWFMALVRLYDLKTLQQVALKLQKTFKNDKYYFWAVMSLYLQGVSVSKETQNVFLPLAERMMSKAVDEKKISNYEELQLYIMILQAVGKREEALKVISGDLGKVCKVEFERNRVKLNLAESLEKRNDPDDWDCFKHIINAVFFDETASNFSEKWYAELFITEFIEDQKAKQKDEKPPKRAPFLANLELLRYFNLFGSNVVCFDDLSCVLNQLPDDKKSNIVKALVDCIHKPPEVMDVDCLRREVNRWKLIVFFNLFSDLEERKKAIVSLSELYVQGIALGESLESTERQYGDDFLLMIAQMIVIISVNQDDENILICLYKRFGAYQPILEISATLDIKHMLHDTLTHLFADKLEQIASPNDVLPRILMAMTIYKSNDTETPEMLVQAYNFGTYSKIPEFIEFRDNLKESMQRAIMRRQILSFEFLRRNDYGSVKDFFAFVDDVDFDYNDEFLDSRYDNRDQSIMKSCMNEDVLEAFKEFRNDRNWLKSRSLCLKIVRDMTLELEDSKHLATLEELCQKGTQVHETISSMSFVSCKIFIKKIVVINSNSSVYLDDLSKSLSSTTWRPDFHSISKLTDCLLAFRYAILAIDVLSKTARKTELALNDVSAKVKAVAIRFQTQLQAVDAFLKKNKDIEKGIDEALNEIELHKVSFNMPVIAFLFFF
ncbi:N-acetyltransferase B complex non catalytic subunit-domain-containing protein [Chytridium lagenaria]|nr:N-acetyltransferase B complex non catalytic subunit-domain-containing protein [Chytridium lagenaria]